uniref:Uncharacterized protein n=1 Tax=Gouania willdenowi TaxID=441366 RepID=A0A8C5E4W5_GOUWI
MNSNDLIQQGALLRWLLSQSDEDRLSLSVITGLSLGGKLLERLTGQTQVEAYKTECVRSIAEFLLQNPSASERQICSKVENSVLVFAARVHALQSRSVF